MSKVTAKEVLPKVDYNEAVAESKKYFENRKNEIIESFTPKKAKESLSNVGFFQG